MKPNGCLRAAVFTSLRIWIEAEFEAEMITRSGWKLFNQIKKAAHMRRLFLNLVEVRLFLLEKESRSKHGHGSQEPLNSPQLHSLPVQQRGSGKNKSSYNRGNYAGTSQNQRY